jgi:hypothetical protein
MCLIYVQYNPDGVEEIISRTLWPHPKDLVIRRNSSLLSSRVHTYNPLFQIYLKLIRVRVESGYSKANSIVNCVPLENVIVAQPEPTIVASRPEMVKTFSDL